MTIQKALYRTGFTIAILAIAAACGSTGASPSASTSASPVASPTASATATATATPRPTDTPWPTVVASPVSSASASDTPGDTSVDTPAPAPDGWKTYTDTTVGIRFSYPPAWTLTTASGYPAVASADNANLVLWMTQAAAGESLEDYKPIDIASMDAEPDDQGVVSIGGVPGWGADWHVTRSGKDLYVIDCFTVRDDKTYDFMWMSSPGNESDDSALFHQIESTLVFTS